MDVSKTYRHINEQLISSENTVDKNAANSFFHSSWKNMQMNKWSERHMPQKSYYIPFKKNIYNLCKIYAIISTVFLGSPKKFQYISIFKLLTLPLHEAANIVVAIILTKATVFIYEDIKLTICTYNINIHTKQDPHHISNIVPQK